MSQMGGQLAYVVSPVILEQLYGQQGDLPFVVTLIPAFVLFVVMLMCNYLPGGKLAGQVSLADTREHEVKLGMMNADNELETEFLGADGRVANKNEMYPSKGTVRPIPAMIPSNEMELEAATLPVSIRFSAPNNDTLPESIQFASPNNDTVLEPDNMEIWCVCWRKQKIALRIYWYHFAEWSSRSIYNRTFSATPSIPPEEGS